MTEGKSRALRDLEERISIANADMVSERVLEKLAKLTAHQKLFLRFMLNHPDITKNGTARKEELYKKMYYELLKQFNKSYKSLLGSGHVVESGSPVVIGQPDTQFITTTHKKIKIQIPRNIPAEHMFAFSILNNAFNASPNDYISWQFHHVERKLASASLFRISNPERLNFQIHNYMDRIIDDLHRQNIIVGKRTRKGMGTVYMANIQTLVPKKALEHLR